MPSTDRLPRPSQLTTLPLDRLTTLYPLAVTRHWYRAGPARIPLSLLVPHRLAHLGPLYSPVHHRRSHSIPIAGTTGPRFSPRDVMSNAVADGKFELLKDLSQRFELRQPSLAVGGDRVAQQPNRTSPIRAFLGT